MKYIATILSISLWIQTPIFGKDLSQDGAYMLERITDSNASAFEALAQDYEQEFSCITGKKKSTDGTYSLDSDWNSPYEGFYWMENNKVLGFCIKGSIDGYSDIMEFYIIPGARNKHIGKKLAFAIFDKYPGKWQVRQIEGAEDARKFWNNTVNEYTSSNYQESRLIDPHWGPVTCQRFNSRTK
jgi:predicted acetyltransferase